jgi:nucleotide-binding universal stress UspA family protein
VGASGSSTLLVAVDFEQASLAALDVAKELAGRLGLQVMVLHVAAVPVVLYPGVDPVMLPCGPGDVTAAARRATEELAERNGAAGAIVRTGDPAAEILRAAQELRPAMVAVGTHGRRGLQRLLLGSVAEKVIRASGAPVLVVPARREG